MQKIISYILVILILYACNNKSNTESSDLVVLNYSYSLKEKRVLFELFNNTNTDFIIIIPNTLTYRIINKSTSEAFKNIHENMPQNIEAYLTNLPKSQSEATLKHIYLDYYKIDESKYNESYKNFLYSAVELKSKQNITLKYSIGIENNLSHKGEVEYKQNIPKMRDLLDNKNFINIIKEFSNWEDRKYKIYLDNFSVKDSLIIKL